MTFDIPELKTVIAQQELILQALKGINIQEWFNIDEACRLKGVNAHTTKNHIFYQPACGRPDKYLHGRKVWHKTTVLRWLSVTDDCRESYIREILGHAS